MDTTRVSLLLRVKDPQDRGSWDEFFKLYYPLLFRYARARNLDQADAEDVAQQCMEQLAKHLPGFTYAKEKGGFKAWLRTMANNKIRDFYKKPKLANPASKDYDRPQEREPTPDDAWESAWLKQHVRYCLDQIKHDVAQKTFDAFHYYAIQGWPVEKVSEVLDMSANQIYVAKSRVAERLRAKLKEVLTELE